MRDLPGSLWFIYNLRQLFDAMASVEGGILRGQGRQHLGGIANVIVYWFIALPAGLALAFKANWGLYGLWGGMVLAICISVF